MAKSLVDDAEVNDNELELARRYPMLVAWSAEDRVLVATFPDVPGLKAYGATAGAAENGDEIVVVWVTAMLDAGRDLPRPSDVPLSA